jgi:Zn-dependent protease with chaperone function
MKHAFRALTALLLLIILPSLALAISQEEEIKLGRQVLADLRPIGFTREPVLTEVGEALKAHVQRKDLPWQFWILEDTKELNAFALPGGFVFINRRYYEMLDGDELAFVIGHEMTHIDERHFEEKLKKAKQAQLYDLLAGVIIRATKADRGWYTVADMGATAFFTKYSRKLEREADLGGYRLAKEAGFDATRAVNALSKLGEDKKDPLFGTLFSTHPLLSSREDRLAAFGEEESQPQNTPRRSVDKAGNPGWKAPQVSKEELKARPGLAVRIVGEDGSRWESEWRDDFLQILAAEIELAGRYDVRGEKRADGRGNPKLSDLRARDKVETLLVVTVHEMNTELQGTIGDDGAICVAKLRISAALTDTSTAAETPLEDIAQVFTDRVFLPADEGRLYLDMPITQAVLSASRRLAARVSGRAEAAAASRH